MNTNYGMVDNLRPGPFPVLDYDQINAKCAGMYTGSPVLEAVAQPMEEHFGMGGSWHLFLVLFLLAIFWWCTLRRK